MTAKEFLVQKGFKEEFTGKDEKAARAICRQAFPNEWKAPEVEASVVYYTPTGKGGNGPGMYLVTQIGKSREAMSRLNDGDKLTDAGRSKLLELASQIADLAQS